MAMSSFDMDNGTSKMKQWTSIQLAHHLRVNGLAIKFGSRERNPRGYQIILNDPMVV